MKIIFMTQDKANGKTWNSQIYQDSIVSQFSLLLPNAGTRTMTQGWIWNKLHYFWNAVHILVGLTHFFLLFSKKFLPNIGRFFPLMPLVLLIWMLNSISFSYHLSYYRTTLRWNTLPIPCLDLLCNTTAHQRLYEHFSMIKLKKYRLLDLTNLQ